MSAWSPIVFSRGEQARGRRFSLAEWASLPEDEPGELVDGALIEEEMTDPVHGLCASWLIARLRSWLGGRGLVFDADVKLAVRKDRGRKADACVYLPGRPPPPRRGLLRTPPDIVVEIVTPTPRDERRDRVEKMDDYAAFGIAYYWLIDPALGSFEIFALSGGCYLRAFGATSGNVPVPGCEGLVIDLDALWGELERLGPEE